MDTAPSELALAYMVRAKTAVIPSPLLKPPQSSALDNKLKGNGWIILPLSPPSLLSFESPFRFGGLVQ